MVSDNSILFVETKIAFYVEINYPISLNGLAIHI